MQFKTKIIPAGYLVLFIFLFSMTSQRVQAHGDGIDGPVVKTAREAIETGNVNLVLIWIQKEQENEIKEAFQLHEATQKSAHAHDSESEEMDMHEH